MMNRRDATQATLDKMVHFVESETPQGSFVKNLARSVLFYTSSVLLVNVLPVSNYIDKIPRAAELDCIQWQVDPAPE